MITDKASLSAAIASYMHRTDLGAITDTFIDFATKRLSRDLRVAENEVNTVLTVVADPMPLPLDFKQMRQISYAGGGAQIALRAASLSQIARYSKAGGGAAFYAVTGRHLLVAPARIGDFNIIYFAALPALVSDDDTNDVLAAHSNLYLYACLMEAFVYAQDTDGYLLAKQNYTQELKEANNSAESARAGAAMAMG